MSSPIFLSVRKKFEARMQLCLIKMIISLAGIYHSGKLLAFIGIQTRYLNTHISVERALTRD